MSLCYITTFNRFLFFLKADVAYYAARLFLYMETIAILKEIFYYRAHRVFLLYFFKIVEIITKLNAEHKTLISSKLMIIV